MDQTGYGIPLVTKRYGKTLFEFLDFFLRVTIPFEFEIENNVIQDDTQNDTQNDTQGGTIDNWIEEQIRKNPKITTEELAKLIRLSRILHTFCFRFLHRLPQAKCSTASSFR